MDKKAVINHIVNWLDEYSTDSKTQGYVIGISGGIDSALTSTLLAKTGRPVLCLEMPIHQAPSHVTRARQHIEFLKNNYPNVSDECVELTATFESLISAFPHCENEAFRALTLANTRARLRMTTLYYFAGLNNDLVAGTGNKVEDFGVGFYTKYGDGGVDLSPIADLLKSQVFALAGELSINQSILNAAPTDGLFGDDRSDEDQLGASYDELEWAMDYQENNRDRPLDDRQKEVLSIYTRLNRANQHKMNPIPICEIPVALK